MPEFANPAQAEEFSDLLKSGLDEVFEDSLPTHEKTYKSWLSESSADEYKEDALVVTGFGAMPAKEVGGKITVDKPLISSQKEYVMKTWALGFVAEYELVRWDRYSIFGDMTKELTKSAVDRCNLQAWAILNNFFSTSDSVFTAYNGEALASTSHALLGGGTLSNRDASDAALSYTALQDARTLFSKLKNERGLFVHSTPYCLIVDPSNRWYAETLVGSQLRPGVANNDKNVLPSFDIKDSPYLTSLTAWFLLAKKSQLRMRFRIGDKPMFRKAFDHSNWNSVLSAYQSNRVEVLHYQGTVASQGDGVI